MSLIVRCMISLLFLQKWVNPFKRNNWLFNNRLIDYKKINRASLQRVCFRKGHQTWSYKKHCSLWSTYCKELVASSVDLSWTIEHDGVHKKSAISHCEHTDASHKDLWDNLRMWSISYVIINSVENMLY